MSDRRDLRLCMVSGSFEYDSHEALRAFGEHIQSRAAVKTTLIEYANEDDNPSLAALDEADVVLVFTRRLRTTGVELERVQAYCHAGRPLVGVRTASHAYQNWLAFDREVLGGNYQNHRGVGPVCHVEIRPEAAAHPVLAGVVPFDSPGSLYINTPIAVDTTVLLTGRTDQATEPVAWTRIHRGGRVFYTSLGHQADMRNESFLRLLTNGVMWAGGRL